MPEAPHSGQAEAATLNDVVAEVRKLRHLIAAGRAELLNAGAAAQLLGISRAALYRLASAGKAPRPVKLAGSSRWRRGDLQAFIAELK